MRRAGWPASSTCSWRAVERHTDTRKAHTRHTAKHRQAQGCSKGSAMSVLLCWLLATAPTTSLHTILSLQASKHSDAATVARTTQLQSQHVCCLPSPLLSQKPTPKITCCLCSTSPVVPIKDGSIAARHAVMQHSCCCCCRVMLLPVSLRALESSTAAAAAVGCCCRSDAAAEGACCCVTAVGVGCGCCCCV